MKLNKYGMTMEQEHKLKRMRKGCWLCGKTKRKDGKKLRLNIDHDHKTGRVRGILCFRCNKYKVGKLTMLEAFDILMYLDHYDAAKGSLFDGRSI